MGLLQDNLSLLGEHEIGRREDPCFTGNGRETGQLQGSEPGFPQVLVAHAHGPAAGVEQGGRCLGKPRWHLCLGELLEIEGLDRLSLFSVGKAVAPAGQGETDPLAAAAGGRSESGQPSGKVGLMEKASRRGGESRTKVQMGEDRALEDVSEQPVNFEGPLLQRKGEGVGGWQ
jgi:hypothetical protein